MRYGRPPLPKTLRRMVRRFYRNHALATAAEARKAAETALQAEPTWPYARKLAGLIRQEARLASDAAPPPYSADFGTIIEHADCLAIALPGLQQAQIDGRAANWDFAAEMLRLIYEQAAAELDAPEPYRASFEALAVKTDALADVLDALADLEGRA